MITVKLFQLLYCEFDCYLLLIITYKIGWSEKLITKSFNPFTLKISYGDRLVLTFESFD